MTSLSQHATGFHAIVCKLRFAMSYSLSLLLLCSLLSILTLPTSAASLLNSTRETQTTAQTDDERLLETGRHAKLISNSRTPDEIKIVCYNIRYRGGDELRELIELLRADAEL
ncbi:MAG: hypothetical protein WKF74_17375, partial [Pyrinomonadaceae bacterium]